MKNSALAKIVVDQIMINSPALSEQESWPIAEDIVLRCSFTEPDDPDHEMLPDLLNRGMGIADFDSKHDLGLEKKILAEERQMFA